MGGKLTSQKSPKLEDLKEDKVNYAPIPTGQLLDGKVGKFTVKVEQMEAQLVTFLQEEEWLGQSDQHLLENGFFKVIRFSNIFCEQRSGERPRHVGERALPGGILPRRSRQGADQKPETTRRSVDG